MANSPRAVRIVLVRPRNPLNLLAAARAAANFGFRGVVVVAPHEPIWREAMATEQASSWLPSARRTATLPEAIEDCDWILGTSCLARRRTEEGQRVLPLDRAIIEARKTKRRSRMAILFGSEKRGLTKEDLDLCHTIIRIPTSEAVPSMNLGQAVAVCCYELRSWGGKPATTPVSPEAERSVTAGEIARLVDAVGAILDADPKAELGPGRQRLAHLRRTLMRLPLTSRDVTLLLGAVRDISWRLENR